MSQQQAERQAAELKTMILQWRALQDSAHGREQANRYAAELFALTGEVLCRGEFVTPAMPAVVDALQCALEFIEDQEDVVDGPDGQPQANRAMRLAPVLRAALCSIGA